MTETSGGAGRRTANSTARVAADRWVSNALRRLHQRALAKAGVAGERLGYPAGIARGVYEDARDLGRGAVLVEQAVDPSSPQHDAALEKFRRVRKGVADYVGRRVADPRLLADDSRHIGAQMRVDHDPSATPAAPTLSGEFGRRFGIGMNDGQLGWDTSSVLLPLFGEVKGALKFGRFATAGPAKYVAMGASPALAQYLAQPYRGAGHHSIAPRRARLPGGAPVPRAVMDSPLNVLKPRNVENGAMYKLHHSVDRFYHGGPVRQEFGGGGWSARRLGWKKSGPVGQLWYGTPGATKAALFAPSAVLQPFGIIDEYGDPNR